MSKQTIAQTLASSKDGENDKVKKSSANRKRLTIGSASRKRKKIPKITKIFKKKTLGRTQEGRRQVQAGHRAG